MWYVQDNLEQARSWNEGRRFRAWQLKQQGWKGQEIADALGVTAGAVSQWLKQAREGGGMAALRHRAAPGRPPRLSAAQRAQLADLLAKGPASYGFSGDVWTAPRVAVVTKTVFGVRYHDTHVRRILRAIGWSVQKPIRRASQRDEKAIAAWRTERWPVIKKRPSRKSAPSSG